MYFVISVYYYTKYYQIFQCQNGMPIRKYKKEVYDLIHNLLGRCPFCRIEMEKKGLGDITDNITGKSCHIQRMSKTSVTLYCKRCFLSFTVTFRSLAESLKTKKDTLVGKENVQLRLWYKDAYDMLVENVNTQGTYRNK